MRTGWKIILVCLLGLAMVSCQSPKKTDSETASTSGSGDNSGDSSDPTAEKSMSFNTEGSDSGQIGGLKTVSFSYDQAVLSSSAREALAGNAKWIKEHGGANVQIEGHCDERGSIEYNLSLGERRARSVKRYLVSLGVQSKRLSVISYGKEKLMDSGDSEDAHMRNRRANFLPIPR